MDKIKLIDKEFWKYIWLCIENTGQKWLTHFEGWKKVTEPVGVAIATVALTLISQRVFNGVLKMSDINIAVISVLGAPILWFGFVYLVKLILSPFRIYKQQEDELEKFNWKKVHFEVCDYDVFKDTGWGIKVTNDKSYDIYINLEMDYLRVGDDLIPPNISRHHLGSINENDNRLEDRIVSPRINENGVSNGILIKSGKEKTFPLTKISEEACSFMTFPEGDRNIDFPSAKSRSLIVVHGAVETEEGLKVLNQNSVEVDIFSNGVIKPFERKNCLWQ